MDESTPLVSRFTPSDYILDAEEPRSTRRGSRLISESAPPSESASESQAGSRSFTRSQKILLLNLSLGNLLATCCIAIMIPFFPHETQGRGVSQTTSGAVFSCFALTQLVFFPFNGRLAPLVGVSRLYNIGLATAGVSTVIFGLLHYIPDTTVFIAACFVTRAVEAIGTSAMHTAARTIIVNQFPDRTGTAMGVAETMAGVGMCLGPAVGGILYELGGYGVPFFTLGVLMLLASGASLMLLPAIEETTKSPQKYRRLLRLFLSAGENWLCCSIVFNVAMNWTALDPNMEPYVNSVLGITPAQLGLYFLVSAGVYSISSALWGRFSDKFTNTYWLMSLCLGIGGLGVMLIPPSPILGLTPSWWLLGVGMVLRELFQGGAYIPVMDRMVRASVARGLEDNIPTQAFVASVFGAMFSLGNVVGPVAGGVVADLAGYPTVATCLGGATLLVCLLTAARALLLEVRKRNGVTPPQVTRGVRQTK